MSAPPTTTSFCSCFLRITSNHIKSEAKKHIHNKHTNSCPQRSKVLAIKYLTTAYLLLLIVSGHLLFSLLFPLLHPLHPTKVTHSHSFILPSLVLRRLSTLLVTLLTTSSQSFILCASNHASSRRHRRRHHGHHRPRF